ncbi:MAG: 1-acyl-sn-glycerol-3-phosphate acyltransferase [Chloroflexi bacterium]|nr:1-acyl-sn-glycerol-3-phosphate acyltransferase [Chloroflexota bacterium]
MPANSLPFGYRLVRVVLRALFRLTCRLEVHGVEILPHSGPYIFVVNHLHLFDAPLIFALLEDRHAMGFIGSTHRRNPIIRWIVQPAGVIWLHRGEPDRAALTAALEALRRGLILGVAPEGTRSKTGGLQPGKEGVAFLASRACVPVYPVGLVNTAQVVPGWKRLRRPRVSVRVGEPFDLAAIEITDRTQRLAVWTDEIMCRIAALLPPEYRGVYAEHPRLKELLAVPR